MPDPNQGGRRSYPLSSLFVLMAACGIVTSLVGPVVRAIVAGDVGLLEATASSVGGSIGIMLLGGTMGLYHYRRVRGLVWGLITGGVIGAVAGTVILTPEHSFASSALKSVLGAVVLVLIGLALRLRHEHDAVVTKRPS